MDAVFKDFRSEIELTRRMQIERENAGPAATTTGAVTGDDKR